MNHLLRTTACALGVVTVAAFAIPARAQAAPAAVRPTCAVDDLRTVLEPDGTFLLRFTVCDEPDPAALATSYALGGQNQLSGERFAVAGPPGTTQEVIIPPGTPRRSTFSVIGFNDVGSAPPSNEIDTIAPFPSEEAFVRRIYRDMTGDEPTDAYVAERVAYFSWGWTGPRWYLESLAQAPLPLVAIEPITSLYDLVLGRLPDAAGLAGWVRAAQGGRTRESIAASMLRSTEHRRRFGPETDTELIRRMYRTIYRVTPDARRVDAWVRRIETGQTTRGAAVEAFSSSYQNWVRTNWKAKVVSAYDLMLGRMPTPAEVEARRGADTLSNVEHVYGTLEYGRHLAATGGSA